MVKIQFAISVTPLSSSTPSSSLALANWHVAISFNLAPPQTNKASSSFDSQRGNMSDYTSFELEISRLAETNEVSSAFVTAEPNAGDSDPDDSADATDNERVNASDSEYELPFAMRMLEHAAAEKTNTTDLAIQELKETVEELKATIETLVKDHNSTQNRVEAMSKAVKSMSHYEHECKGHERRRQGS